MTNDTLQFRIAVPPAWASADLLRDDNRERLPDSVADVLAMAARGGGEAQLLMLRSLIAVTTEREPLAAGLAVLLADVEAPIASSPLSPESFAGARVDAITLALGSGIRVRRSFDTEFDGLPIEALQVQYHLHTEHGLLTISFTTPQAAETDDWEDLFDALVQTAQLV